MPEIEVTRERLEEDYPLYARLCLKIANKAAETVPLKLNHSQQRVQQAIDFCIRNRRPPRLVELKARQTGLSTDAEGRLFHRCHLRRNRNALIVAHKRDSARAIFRMARRFYTNLPAALAPEKKHFTTGEIEFASTGSRLQIEVANEGGGRGYTAQYVHLSECAFYADMGAVLTAVLQAVPATMDSLVIAESTPNGMNQFHDLWVQAKSGRSDWIPVFIPWFDEPAYRMPANFTVDELREDEHVLVQRHGVTLEQLAWRRWCIENNLNGDAERFTVEYPSDDRSCFLASGRPAFEPDAIEYYNGMVPPAVPADSLPPRGDIEWDSEKAKPRLTLFPSGPLRIYEEPKERHLYIVGVDPSEGDRASDPSPVIVTSRMSLSPVAVWNGRKRPDRLAHVARALAVYFNNAYVVWEANAHGLAFQIEFEKLYHDFYMREASPESVTKRLTDKPGFYTSGKSRHFLVHTLRRVINEKLAMIRDPALVAELSWFYYQEKSDRPGALSVAGHLPGKTDDLLMAYALTLEAHRGSPDEPLAPLDPDAQRTALDAYRASLVARSMGIDTPAKNPRLLDLTAEELEALDEMEYRKHQRLERLGIPSEVP